MRVNLINPIVNSPNEYMPLGILYLASALRSHDIDVGIIDLKFKNDIDDFNKEFLNNKPDVLGISFSTLEYGNALKIIKKSKEINPDVKIVLGGPHATVFPDDCMSQEDVDYVVYGEGEQTLVELVNFIKDAEGSPRDIAGIYFRENGKIKKTEPRPNIENLDELPFPAIDLLPDVKKYLNFIPFSSSIIPSTPIIASRGCPFNCTFCQPILRTLFGKNVRYRSAVNIVDEIESLVGQFGLRFVGFQDSTFTANKQLVDEFCDEVNQRGLDISFYVNGRVNVFTKELALRLKNAGCVCVLFGVESGSPRIRNEVLNKNVTNEQIIRAYKICSEVGIKSQASTMIGSPGDSKETIEETIDLIKKINPDMLDSHYTIAIPGSYLYSKSLEAGKLLHKDWAKYDQHSDFTMKLEHMPYDELTRLYLRLYEEHKRQKSLFKVITKKTYLLGLLMKSLQSGLRTKNPGIMIKIMGRFLIEQSYIAYKIKNLAIKKQ